VADDKTESQTDAGSSELDEALSAGALTELPPNRPRGILGEHGPSLRKVDTFEPDLNAGVSQENDGPVIQLAIILAFLLFFPVGYWLLWRSSAYSRRGKLIITVVATLVIALVTWRLVGLR